jgi:3-deoxy-7-phosphoheptulonate synthase
MLLRLRSSIRALESEVLRMEASARGYEVRFLDSGRRLVELVRPAGAPPAAPSDRVAFEDLAFVAAVLESADAPELHARAGRESTVVRIGEAAFGGPYVSLVAGPCAVETEERLLEIARAVRAAGATVLRGGAFKPRTSPYSFRGLGAEGLELLARARAETGLAVVTEVLDPRDVDRVAQVADAIQVGSRSMSSGALLAEVGRAGKPVVLKRGLAATVQEFLQAAEHVLSQGNDQVVLCERGVRGFDGTTRNLLDVGAVAWLERATHLPVIVDPSHAAGRPDLVAPLARAGLAAGAAGLIVEVHPEPAEARSDGRQAISAAEFHRIARQAAELARLGRRRLVLPTGVETLAEACP